MGVGHVVHYLNGVASAIEGYSGLRLTDRSPVQDIQALFSDLDDLYEIDKLLERGSSETRFFRTYDFLELPQLSTALDRTLLFIEEEDEELQEAIMLNLGALMEEGYTLDGSAPSMLDDVQEDLNEDEGFKSVIQNVAEEEDLEDFVEDDPEEDEVYDEELYAEFDEEEDESYGEEFIEGFNEYDENELSDEDSLDVEELEESSSAYDEDEALSEMDEEEEELEEEDEDEALSEMDEDEELEDDLEEEGEDESLLEMDEEEEELEDEDGALSEMDEEEEDEDSLLSEMDEEEEEDDVSVVDEEDDALLSEMDEEEESDEDENERPVSDSDDSDNPFAGKLSDIEEFNNSIFGRSDAVPSKKEYNKDVTVTLVSGRGVDYMTSPQKVVDDKLAEVIVGASKLISRVPVTVAGKTKRVVKSMKVRPEDE